MAEQKATPKTETRVAAAPTPTLTPAGESSDPTVHRLLAEIESARINGDTDEVASLVDYLNTLGYSA